MNIKIKAKYFVVFLMIITVISGCSKGTEAEMGTTSQMMSEEKTYLNDVIENTKKVKSGVINADNYATIYTTYYLVDKEENTVKHDYHDTQVGLFDIEDAKKPNFSLSVTNDKGNGNFHIAKEGKGLSFTINNNEYETEDDSLKSFANYNPLHIFLLETWLEDIFAYSTFEKDGNVIHVSVEDLNGLSTAETEVNYLTSDAKIHFKSLDIYYVIQDDKISAIDFEYTADVEELYEEPTDFGFKALVYKVITTRKVSYHYTFHNYNEKIDIDYSKLEPYLEE